MTDTGDKNIDRSEDDIKKKVNSNNEIIYSIKSNRNPQESRSESWL